MVTTKGLKVKLFQVRFLFLRCIFYPDPIVSGCSKTKFIEAKKCVRITSCFFIFEDQKNSKFVKFEHLQSIIKATLNFAKPAVFTFTSAGYLKLLDACVCVSIYLSLFKKTKHPAGNEAAVGDRKSGLMIDRLVYINI